MEPEKVYGREDSSAWQGDIDLAYFCGLLAGALSREVGAQGWEVCHPCGYAPELEIHFLGNAFRLSVRRVERKKED